MVSISSLFTYLGMPLVNQRWSWGASNDKCVVLRVWQDDVRIFTIKNCCGCILVRDIAVKFVAGYIPF